MEYDEQVSARLHMSLDEIIGQEQQDGTSQVKKRRPRGGAPGPSSPQPATSTSLPSKPPSLPAPESAPRCTAPLPPPFGNPSGFPSRPSPSARSLPALMRGPPGRLSGHPSFGMGPRPLFPVPPGHTRIDPSWPRARHLVGGYLLPPNGMQPPPPPMGAGPGIRCGPPRGFPLPPRPGGAGEVGYSPRRPLVGPYGVSHPMQPGPPRPGWRRSRYLDDVQEQNGEHSPHHPMGYPGGIPPHAAGPTPHLVGESNGSLANQMPYGFASRGASSVCENRPAPDYFDPTYAQDSGVDREHMYGVPAGEVMPHMGQRGHAGLPEKVMSRQAPPDQCTSGPDFPLPASRAHPVAAAAPAVGTGAGAPSQGERREFTVIVSNVPKDLPAVEIQEAFSCMGTVLRTDIMLNSKVSFMCRLSVLSEWLRSQQPQVADTIALPAMGEHTGRVCIAYASAEAAKTAVAQFDEGDLNGNTIRVFAE